MVVPGIITSASKTSIKATKIVMKCSECGHEKVEHLRPGFSSISLPRTCDNN